MFPGRFVADWTGT